MVVKRGAIKMDKNLMDFVVSTLIATCITLIALSFDELRTLLLYVALLFAAIAIYNVFAYVQRQKKIEKARELNDRIVGDKQ